MSASEVMPCKPKALEMSLTAANTVNNAVLVRVYASTEAVITIADSSGANTGSLTVPAGAVSLIEKDPLDTLTASTSVKAVSVSYK